MAITPAKRARQFEAGRQLITQTQRTRGAAVFLAKNLRCQRQTGSQGVLVTHAPCAYRLANTWRFEATGPQIQVHGVALLGTPCGQRVGRTFAFGGGFWGVT
jgi:hypothetical protein